MMQRSLSGGWSLVLFIVYCNQAEVCPAHGLSLSLGMKLAWDLEKTTEVLGMLCSATGLNFANSRVQLSNYDISLSVAEDKSVFICIAYSPLLTSLCDFCCEFVIDQHCRIRLHGFLHLLWAQLLGQIHTHFTLSQLCFKRAQKINTKNQHAYSLYSTVCTIPYLNSSFRRLAGETVGK